MQPEAGMQEGLAPIVFLASYFKLRLIRGKGGTLCLLVVDGIIEKASSSQRTVFT